MPAVGPPVDERTSSPSAPPRNLTRYAWLAIATAIATISLKFGAYLLTGSVGLLSDAAESVVNLVAAVVALVALRVAAMPPDDNHQFGHAKAEYFSAAVEGMMIFVAAVFILWTSVERFLNPQPLENVGVGLAVSVVASVLNGVVAMILIRAGRQHRSITLTADGRHLLTDVWTSAGVLVGVLLVSFTGWLRLDPIIAFLVGANIIRTGVGLIRESVDGLMDHVPEQEWRDRLEEILDRFRTEAHVDIHDVRSRVVGHLHHVTMHVLVPGDWTVQRGHDLLEEIEEAVRADLKPVVVDTHLEPIEDPRAYDPLKTH